MRLYPWRHFWNYTQQFYEVIIWILKKAIMFLAGLIKKLNIPHSGGTLHGEEWDMLYALKDGDFSVFDNKDEQE